MEYLVTVTMRPSSEPAEADALLDAFVGLWTEASPVVAEDLAAGTIDVTWSVDADSLDEAWSRSRQLLDEAVREIPLEQERLLGARVELAQAALRAG
jgi:hypothetical protein